MELSYPDEYRRLQEYAARKRIDLLNRLGYGMDGLVYSTKQRSAVKAHRKKGSFEKELRIFQILAEQPSPISPGSAYPECLNTILNSGSSKWNSWFPNLSLTSQEQQLAGRRLHLRICLKKTTLNGEARRLKRTANLTGNWSKK